ncbi:hypothetical protein [Streptomyces neyagawaensis]|nr:hypothetical protein [Streptomyces neyagawaensis]MDE1685843.1 hypothetical protein [Streptomyces neyagawaensis]
MLAAPAVSEVVSALTDHSEQTQVDAARKKPKKPPRHQEAPVSCL